MANNFYQHSGWPGTRAPNASASWRSEFGLIEAGFDKLPDVGTANLFTVTDGSAMVGKTAAQAKVILSLGNVDNTSDADKPISTLALAALNLKADLAALNLKANISGFARTATSQIINTNFLVQFGAESFHATPNTERSHSFGTAFTSLNGIFVQPIIDSTSFGFSVYGNTTAGFRTKATAGGVGFYYLAIGVI